jgi:probable HAF family extracellular repeat protein
VRCTESGEKQQEKNKMKSKGFVCVAILLLATLAVTVQMPAQVARPAQVAKRHHYKVVDLGTFGGPISTVTGFSHSLTSRGAVVGGADTPDANPNPGCYNSAMGGTDCNVNHAFQWRHGTLTDLGTLPGAVNSFSQGANVNGWVIGTSENGVTDPVVGIPEFDAVLWRRGQIKNLGTLGGNESLAFDVNYRGQIVGLAANAVPDPVSMWGFATQTRPFLWEDGVMRDLDTLGGADGAAFLLNKRGQIMGQYYVRGTTTIHSMFWDEVGNAVDVGSLGGTNSNCSSCGPWWMNNRGQMVGNSTLAGDAIHHGFLWDRGTLTDLGTLGGNNSEANWINDSGLGVGRSDMPGSLTHHGVLWTRKHGGMTMTDLGVIGGDACSTAYSINSYGVIVGDAGICFRGGRAWLSENGGPMVDLNDLALPGSGLHLQDARLINDRGEIVCTGVLPNGDQHAVLLIPVDEDDSASRGAAAIQSPAPHDAPGATQHRTQSRWSNRYRMPGLPGLKTPVSEAKQAIPAGTISATDYLRDADGIGQARGRPGFCTANSSGLTGGCVGYSYVNFCSAKRSAACPRGLKAKKPGYYQCSLMQKDFVDLGRSCSY